MARVGSAPSWIKNVLVVVGVAMLLLLAYLALGLASMQEHPALAPLAITTADLPSGFAEDDARVQASASSAADPGSVIRDWVDVAGGRDVRLLIDDDGTPASAAGSVNLGMQDLLAHGLTELQVPVAGARGATWSLTVSGRTEDDSEIFFGRGPLLVVVRVGVVLPGDNVGLANAVSQAEANKMASLYSAQPSKPFDGASSLGYLLGAFIGYFLLLGIWAHVRDPLRTDDRGPAWPPAGRESASALDVSAAAKKLRRRAIVVFLVQMLAVSLMLAAALPPLDLAARIWLLAGGALLYVAFVWFRGRHSRRGAVGALGGQRPVWAIALFGFASLFALAGCFCVLLAATSGTDVPGSDGYLGAAICLLVAAGICQRRARRLASMSAQRLLERDPRPMVLYLRSFGDDSARVRRAALARRSLIERFSPSRYDSFEEVLVRQLTTVGPVVAINPPGTRLAPLGAARETMPHDAWQGRVDDWINHAALVVISSPPSVASPGLVWELQQVTDRGRWGNTLIVVPPVPDAQVRWRFQAFASAGAERWPFRSPLPADPARILTLSRRGGHWQATTADRRNEWSYGAAIDAAVASMRPVAASAAVV